MRWAHPAAALAVVSAMALSPVSAPAAEHGPAYTPAEAVRACPGKGPGFVAVPGTSTCIRISGRVASEYGASMRRIAREDIAGFGARGQVSMDTRTDTEYGPLRSFVRVRAGSNAGR